MTKVQWIKGLGDDPHRTGGSILGFDAPTDACGHQDDRRFTARRAQRLEGCRAVEPRHHHVEQDQVGRGRGQGLEAVTRPLGKLRTSQSVPRRRARAPIMRMSSWSSTKKTLLDGAHHLPFRPALTRPKTTRTPP